MEPWALPEFGGACLADERHRGTLVMLADRLSDQCGASFSVVSGHAGRQAARRVFHNRKSQVSGLIKGHVAETVRRCREHPLILAIQDTTVLDFSSHPATVGLGPLSNDDYVQGLLAHSVYAVTPDGLPLGILGLSIWARDAEQKGQSANRRERTTSDKESFKWIRGLRCAADALSDSQPALLVQDREADVFDLFAEPRPDNLHLLVRACRPRRVELMEEAASAGKTDMLSAARSAPTVAEMTVRVPRKPGQPERETRLAVQARSVRVFPPRHSRPDPPGEPQVLWLICATEETPPSGEEAIQWILLTSLPIESGADACQIVRFYSVRWSIERLHFILKSGCRVERLQIDQAHALKNALALYYIIAWRLHWLTHIARTEPNRPANTLLDEEYCTVLAAATQHSVRTAAEAVLAIARLGGYVPYKSAKPPGVKTLWQGLRKLDDMVQGWRIAQSQPKNVNQD